MPILMKSQSLSRVQNNLHPFSNRLMSFTTYHRLSKFIEVFDEKPPDFSYLVTPVSMSIKAVINKKEVAGIT